ncbi:hypothetical protein LCGC14_2031250 [marine sediment metagenome]|uniref:NTP pyrophosphohydrolase MazG putative catalytic core domain-containing protein n=1 Tax=marine sediment metagenome TaxID=412755 RepID=A0A0F9FH90_9ZZZZ
MEIQDLIDQSHGIAKDKGWWNEERTFLEQAALYVTEVAEAIEEWRGGHGMTEIYYEYGDGEIKSMEPPPKPEGIPIELADILIRVADTCGKYGIDLDHAIWLKLRYNETRPYRHGGKLA